ncbi:MAG TPA: hypothetical protein VMR25_07565 [Planctomycetaceae bacterium]|jgi:hypothetical protein|nr:hypothetical protein [Planctomycetaceae bacterium]
MVDRRVVQIAAEEAERKRKQQEEDVERQRRVSEFDAFDSEWKTVYPTQGQVTPEGAIEIAAKYMCLADGIRDRLWDFHIAELLRMLTAVQNGGAGRLNLVALGW